MSIGIVRALRLLASQKPSLPPRTVVDRSRVERHRHHHVPVTWIDKHLAETGTLVHLHGGAYIAGPDRRTWEWLEEVGRRAGVATAMIHYRMPPRFPFPHAFEDAVQAITGMDQQIQLRRGRWLLSGNGAGAGLALAVAQLLTELGDPRPERLLLSSPWADLTTDRHGSEELRTAARLYAGSIPREDPRLSPVHGDLGDLPAVHLIVGGEDLLLEDSRRLREKILAVGGEIDYLEVPGQGHDVAVEGSGPASQTARRAQIAAVREALSLDETH